MYKYNSMGYFRPLFCNVSLMVVELWMGNLLRDTQILVHDRVKLSPCFNRITRSSRWTVLLSNSNKEKSVQRRNNPFSKDRQLQNRQSVMRTKRRASEMDLSGFKGRGVMSRRIWRHVCVLCDSLVQKNQGRWPTSHRHGRCGSSHMGTPFPTPTDPSRQWGVNHDFR